MALNSVGLLGGTFDPIHLGHLHIATVAQHDLGFDEIRFLPCGTPAHKQNPVASPAQRSEMIRLAIADQSPQFILDERELRRPGKSYMVDTLRALRDEVGTDYALSLIVGMDAFLELPTWHKWQEVITMSHLVVMHRLLWNQPPSGVMAEFCERYATQDAARLTETPCGSVYFHASDPMDVSASEIRMRIRDRQSVHYLLPEPVWDYIRTHGLYL